MPDPFRPETAALVLIDHQVGTMAGVQFTATNTIIAELAQDWSSPHGSELIQLLFTDVLPEVRRVDDGSAAAA